ncbi:MAG: hypothetical protein AAGF02_16825 [Actinomycetota bacterium]
MDDGAPDRAHRRPSLLWAVVPLAILGVIAALVIVDRQGDDTEPAATTTSAMTTETTIVPAGRWDLVDANQPMSVLPYAGLGAWVDVFDFDPAYQDGGRAPVVTADDLAIMAAAGVETVYLQAARLDDRSPDGLAAPDLVATWLDTAAELELDIVAWYLPTFADVDADLERLDLLRRFETGRGNRFAGVGVDIEFRGAVEDDAVRSARLVELSSRLTEIGLPGDAWSGIVLPPTLLEVVNPDFWPGFPWAGIAPHYEVWMPMSYWTGRTEASGLRDGLDYNVDAVRRLRANIADPDAIVHSIGGIGDETTEGQLRDFVVSLGVTGSIGGSIYDYRTLSSGGWAVLRDGVADAVAPIPPVDESPLDEPPDADDP